MKISIHQPAYLPWLGYLEKIAHSDIFIFLDTVQFSKNSFDNRNRIPDNAGHNKWLTIPIQHSGRFGQDYNQCTPDHYNWVKSHTDIIKQRYADAPYFKTFFPKIEEMIGVAGLSHTLADIDYIILEYLMEIFGIHTEIVRLSEYKKIAGKGSDLVLNICKEFDTTEYYSGKMGRDYLKIEDFTKNNIKVTFQEYEPPTEWSCIHQLFINGPEL